jgi:hypothetical protein
MNITTQQAAEELKKRTYYEQMPGGGIVAYDMLTGKIIGKSSDMLELMGADTTHRSYHPLIVDSICDTMVERGLTLSQVCKLDGYPKLATLMRWQRVYPEIKQKIDEAREMQAEQFYTKMVNNLNEMPDDLNRDEVQVQKLKFEKLKYLAGVSNPYRYGNRTIHSGDAQAPVQFVISTGINRDQGVQSETGTDTEREERVGDTEPRQIEDGADD